jgi:hypothetical protein
MIAWQAEIAEVSQMTAAALECAGNCCTFHNIVPRHLRPLATLPLGFGMSTLAWLKQ